MISPQHRNQKGFISSASELSSGYVPPELAEYRNPRELSVYQAPMELPDSLQTLEGLMWCKTSPSWCLSVGLRNGGLVHDGGNLPKLPEDV